MSGRAYSTTVPGKWVLAGEHTVLRGGTAIALPHPEFRLNLEFRPGEETLAVEPDPATPILHDLLHLAEAWLVARGIKFEFPRGTLVVESTIPNGAGLGSSAALSVAVARWVLSAHSMEHSLERELGRELENHFHGKSSGMDVAVVSIGEPIYFSMAGGAIELGIRHLPSFVFRDTGLRASTRECIARVEAIRSANPVRGDLLDQEMGRASREILDGLRAYDDGFDRGDSSITAPALEEIARGMRRAETVFTEWGLVPEVARGLIEGMEGEGIRSPRLTGAGGGGFVVGLFTGGQTKRPAPDSDRS